MIVVPAILAAMDPATVTDENDAAPDWLMIQLVAEPFHTPILAPLLMNIYVLGVAFRAN